MSRVSTTGTSVPQISFSAPTRSLAMRMYAWPVGYGYASGATFQGIADKSNHTLGRRRVVRV